MAYSFDLAGTLQRTFEMIERIPDNEGGKEKKRAMKELFLLDEQVFYRYFFLFGV